jgi:hypothetical protein
LRTTVFSLSLAFAVAGCGSGDDMMGPVDAAADLTTVTPPDMTPPGDMTPPVPILSPVDPHSGKVLSSVNLVTVTFDKYQYQNTVQSFGDFVVKSNWYSTIGKDYGVGPGTHLAKVVLTDPADQPGAGITDKQVVALLTKKINDGTLPKPPMTNDQNLYMVYFPSTTTVNQPDGSALCSVFAGYHSSATYVGGGKIIYAVIGDCGFGGLDYITSTVSHELAEAATDPFPGGSGSYRMDVMPPDPWTFEDGQEVGDLCETEDDVYESDQFGTWALQPIWSNSAAAAMMNPCIPSDGKYNTVTVIPADVPTVAAGQSFTFRITGWANYMTQPWMVRVGDGDYSFYSATDLQANLSGMSINNKGTLTLTLKAPVNANSGDPCGVKVLSGPTGHIWPVGFIVQ